MPAQRPARAERPVQPVPSARSETTGQLKTELVALVQAIDGVTHRPSPVAGGSALFFGDREFAHFHSDNELDLKLTRAVIRELGLAHPVGSVHHPKRAASSPWIELRFAHRQDIERVAELVRRAVAAL